MSWFDLPLRLLAALSGRWQYSHSDVGQLRTSPQFVYVVLPSFLGLFNPTNHMISDHDAVNTGQRPCLEGFTMGNSALVCLNLCLDDHWRG